MSTSKSIMKAGIKVKFNYWGGSIGKVISVNYDATMSIEWCYGLDRDGIPITAISHEVSPANVIVIPDDLYQEYILKPIWSEAQKVAYLKISEAIWPVS
jgi:hypothetical protein